MILELMSDPAVWVAFLTLTVMEIVLGIDNIVFISVLVSRLPKEQADRARKIGLALALIFRILLLLVITWIIALDNDVIELFGVGLSWKDIILIAGGGFLIYKATHEMHAAIEDPHEAEMAGKVTAAFGAVIGQIIAIDMVFSIDSIITAVGMADHVEVMIAAVIVAVGVMFVASGPVADFVSKHPTTKMLALAFLLLIGVSLVADGLGFHIPKGYIYSAMAFSVLVEAINIIASDRRKRRHGGAPPVPPGKSTVSTGVLAGEAAAAVAPKPRARPKSTDAARAKSRPKSAPRKKP
ncbi:MAG TPA: TerC family protein [Devosiaceae bacterium]|jgi:predicted tellurium resistance membrane protein TerC|nr:TerC family protein [Devosiaceae bacterium]